MGGSAWTLAWRPAVFWARALDCVSSRWLFARGCTLHAGLILGAGWTGEDLGSGRICVQLSFLLLSFLPLVFFLPLSGNKAKGEEKVKKKKKPHLLQSSRWTEVSRRATTPQDGYRMHCLRWASSLNIIASTSLDQALWNVA